MKMRKQHIYCETPTKEEKVVRCPFHVMKNTETMICSIENDELICFYNVGADVPEKCPLRKGSITLHYYLKGIEND